MLGLPGTGLHENRWKCDLAEAAESLGWQVEHLPARGIATDDVVRASKDADCLLWARTHHHQPDGPVGDMLRRVEDGGTATVGLHLDLYWGLPHREPQIGNHPWWSCQYIFTADGGVRDWRGRGVNHYWCPPPMGSRFLGRAQPAARFMHHAAFVGGIVPHIHGPHRANLLAWAWGQWGLGFARYGGLRKVWGAELSALYASARVVVGDSARAPRYWSDRVPLSLGRGALLAHPVVDGMDELGLTDDVMVRYRWGHYGDIADRLSGMTEADCNTVRDNAVALVWERHLWTHRLLDIQKVVFGS